MANSTYTQSNKTIDKEALVQFYNDEMFNLHMPAVIYTVVILIIGLIANTMVCYFYGFKSRKSTTNFFIIILSMYDITVCCVSIPGEITNMSQYYTFKNRLLCKGFRFLTFYSAVGSAFTLIAIAAERFRRICRPANQQMTLICAKRLCLFNVFFALLLSAPSIFMFDSTVVDIPNIYGIELYGRDCTMTKDTKYVKYVAAFVFLYAAGTFIISIGLIVVYAKVGISIRNQEKRMRQHVTAGKKSDSASRVCSNKEQQRRKDFSNQRPDSGTSNISKSSIEFSQESSLSVEDIDIKTDISSNKAKNKIEIKRVTRLPNSKFSARSKRVTLEMAIVTFGFIFSFIPNLSVICWRMTTEQHETKTISGENLIAYRIATLSYLIESALNPLIFGSFNEKFREFFFRCSCGSIAKQ